jgi:tetratricopeptide (TPR) repeat protein
MKNPVIAKLILAGIFCLLLFCVPAYAQNANELVARAKTSIDKKEYDSALADLTQAIKKEKQNAEAYALRGDVYMQQSQVLPARADYDQAIKLNPKNAQFFYKRALSFEHTPGFSQASTIADYTRVLELEPNNEKVLRERGYLYSVTDNPAAAVADFEAVLKLNPDDAQIYYWLGRAHAKTNADQALADFTKYLALKTDDPYGYGERATIYESRAQWGLALTEYNQVIKLIPKEVYGYGNRAMIYLQLKRYPEAIADLTSAIELKPGESSSYSQRGKAYEIWGKYDLAIEDYHLALNYSQYNNVAKARIPIIVEKIKAANAHIKETADKFNNLLAIYSAAAEDQNSKVQAFLALDDSQAKLPQRDVKLLCTKVLELNVVLNKAVTTYAPMREMYDKGELAGFDHQLDVIEEIQKILDRAKFGIQEYIGQYKCH